MFNLIISDSLCFFVSESYKFLKQVGGDLVLLG